MLIERKTKNKNSDFFFTLSVYWKLRQVSSLLFTKTWHFPSLHPEVTLNFWIIFREYLILSVIPLSDELKLSLVSASLLRCSSPRCDLEAAARCTSWLWTETASWTGEGAAASGQCLKPPAGSREPSATAETHLTHAHDPKHPSISSTVPHTSHSYWSNTHTYLNPLQHTLLMMQFRQKASNDSRPGIILKNRWIFSKCHVLILKYVNNIYIVQLDSCGEPVFSFNYLVPSSEVH